MRFRHSSRAGYAFRIGGTHLYVGPGDSGLGNGPVLAISRGTEQTVVATFPNATTAESFIEALKTGIDELHATAPAARATATETDQP